LANMMSRAIFIWAVAQLVADANKEERFDR